MPTIGVALAIPEPWASQLQDYRTSIGDTTATMIPTHITLIPPIEVAEDDLPEVEKHLAEVAERPRPSASTCAAPAPSGRSPRSCS